MDGNVQELYGNLQAFLSVPALLDNCFIGFKNCLPKQVVDRHDNGIICPSQCLREGGEVGTNYRGPGPVCCVCFFFSWILLLSVDCTN